MIFEGSTVSPGRARGRARAIDAQRILESILDAGPQGPPTWEVERLQAAIGRACVQLERINRQLAQRIGLADAAIFQTHEAVLRDANFIGQIKNEIQQNGFSAEAAVARVVKHNYDLLASSPVPLVRDKAADILDIGRRLIRCLQAVPGDRDESDPDAVIIARELTPSELVRFFHQNVKGFVTETCGPKSHTAILARSLGVAMLTDVGRVTEQIVDGANIFVDATEAKVYTGDDIKRTATPAPQPASECVRVPTPATTADDVRITLLLSISDSAEGKVVRKLGADGVGLWRTEFLFMGRTHWPSEEEIYEELRKVAAHIGDAELNIRLADFGAEKCPIYADIPVNRNPSLGLRGLRLLLQREDILRPQLGAIVALARQRPVTLLLPMLDSVDTLEMATNRFCHIAGCRGRRTLPFQLGAMVEMPSAALMVADILDEVDAISIGLNDLTQYTLAADRDDELVEAYHDPMHPAVIRLLRQIIEAATAKSKLVTACGDLAGDIQTMGLLLALGIRRFSVSQVDFPKLTLALPNISVRSLAPLAAELETLRSAKAVRQRVAERLGVTSNADEA